LFEEMTRQDKALRLVFGADATRFRSGWLLESVAAELVVMLVLRTHRPFFRIGPSSTRLGSSVAVAPVSLALIFSPLPEPLDLSSLPPPVLTTVVAITAGYVVATELVKARFSRRADVATISVG